jgi:hypothetical protein
MHPANTKIGFFLDRFSFLILPMSASENNTSAVLLNGYQKLFSVSGDTVKLA